MVHLFGLKPVFLCCGSKEKVLSAKQLAEEGFSVHAGADEQSQLPFLRPEFVPVGHRSAPSLTGANFADLVRIAKAEGWPGYFGAPRLATAAMGAQEFALSSQNVNAMALQILDGLDSRKIPSMRTTWIRLTWSGKMQSCNMSRRWRSGNWTG
jgi:hypothetical protein